jgi:hypothetical protein
LKAFALLAVAAMLGGCLLDIDFDNTRFTCGDGVCPDGFTCVEGTCVTSSAGQDGGTGGDAAARPDAPPPDADTATPACNDQFGGAPSYQLCVADATSCEFFVTSDVATACNDICPQYGGATCVNSFDATAGTECTREVEGNCTATHQSQICICSHN